MATILQLQQELQARIQSTATFTDSGFEVFNLDDLGTWKEAGAQLPIAGVAYEGCEILSPEIDTHRNSRGSRSTNTQRVSFSVIIGIDYAGAGGPDTKDTALSLLQEVREALHGYRNVNSRPWTFVYERPIDGDTTDGVIYYGQLWMTDIHLIGDHTEQ